MRQILPNDATKKGSCFQMLSLPPLLPHIMHATRQIKHQPNRPNKKISLMCILSFEITRPNEISHENIIRRCVETG